MCGGVRLEDSPSNMEIHFVHRKLCLFLLPLAFIGDALKTAVLPASAVLPAPSNIPVAFAVPSNNWTHIGSKAGIETYVKHIEGSNLLAFRGVAYIDAHISQAIGPFMNLSLSHEWVSMLKHIQQFPIDNAAANSGSATNNSTSKVKDEDMVYQVRTNTRVSF